ncbi:MAG: ABC transporter permease, partial [Anaerolineales bacterium]|nr:ABC transporter permease [Anaerolineales bacterium]
MLWEMVLVALREIRRNVLRSSLTVLGIVIGVAAVITMVTLGSGVTAQVTADISSLGTNLLDVRPGQGFHGPGGVRRESTPFEMEDAEAIARDISGLSAVAPVASKPLQAIYGNENWSTTVTGSNNAYLLARNWDLAAGRRFTYSELQSGKAVCILGATVRDKLFGAQDMLGTSIRLGKLSCRVIGVFESKGQSSFGMDQDDFVLIPLRTLHRRIAGNQDVSAISVSAREGVSTDKVKRDIEQLMRERRRVSPGKDDDFHVRNMEELVGTMTS